MIDNRYIYSVVNCNDAVEAVTNQLDEINTKWAEAVKAILSACAAYRVVNEKPCSDTLYSLTSHKMDAIGCVECLKELLDNVKPILDDGLVKRLSKFPDIYEMGMSETKEEQ